MLCLLIFSTQLTAQVQSRAIEDYTRANFCLDPKQSKIYEAFVKPHWIGDGAAFWYEKAGVSAKEYFLVIPSQKTKSALFNRAMLAQLLAKELDKEIDKDDLPITISRFELATKQLEFNSNGQSYNYDIPNHKISPIKQGYIPSPIEVISPNKKLVAFVEDYNLFVKEIESGKITQLTSDGAEFNAYASASNTRYPVTFKRMKVPPRPILEWSKDSTQILTHQIDERNVKSSYLWKWSVQTVQ